MSVRNKIFLIFQIQLFFVRCNIFPSLTKYTILYIPDMEQFSLYKKQQEILNNVLRQKILVLFRILMWTVTTAPAQHWELHNLFRSDTIKNKFYLNFQIQFVNCFFLLHWNILNFPPNISIVHSSLSLTLSSCIQCLIMYLKVKDSSLNTECIKISKSREY